MLKKKDNLLPEERLIKAVIPKEEEPYKVPDNWVWTRLGNILELKNGVAVNSNEYGTGNTPLIRISNIQNNRVDLTEAARIKLQEKYKKYLLEKNDLLLAMSGATTGKIGIFNEDIICVQNQRVGNLKIKYGMTHGYRNYYFQKMQEELLRLAYGGAQPNISGNIIENLLLPLSPLEEQKRIVEKLDSLFEKIGKIKEIIEEIKEKTSLRREAVLSKAFTGELTEKWRAENKTENAKELLLKINEEKLKNNLKAKIKDVSEMLVNEDEVPYKVPENWVWTRLGDITEINPKKKVLDFNEDEEVSFVPMKSVSEETGRIEKIEYEKYSKLKKGYTQFIEEDVLFAKITPCMENGKCAIAENLKNNIGYGTTEFHVLRCYQGVINSLLHKFLRQENFRKEAEYNMTGSVGFRRVPVDFLKSTLFPLPPLDEQKEIVRILDKVFEEENKISELISLEEKVEILEKTILDKAFRGELGTGNSDDEPAIELLKRALEKNK
ncbi:restriction endonuclease subunit S [Fusobacterium perfoetens]|uniref:restriction endonuclease subunit S n=1 Tax=Fusobacterium perfoetens TaxID=852 RepID=UPI001F20A91F|nr:restriction endonuclease subunit S [Fusobacterium perfoetens]MCF2624745.1 restriction endonuclease subunit S [Fusobacterium perfoetens]